MAAIGDRNPWILFGVALALLLVVAAIYHATTPPVRPIPWYNHVIFAVFAAATFGIPPSASCYIFDGLSVAMIGTVFPIYESLRAICTPDEDDDKYWLQYYMVGGVLYICTQFVDEWLDDPEGVTYWFQGMFFLYLWLYLPKTEGAILLYDNFTEPYLAPLVKPATARLNNIFSMVYHASINACHIALLVLFFVFFPDRLKKVIAVAVGTVYPLMASITAATTEDVADDTYWLTYWTCYNCLFLLMELLETWLGWIPGFYAFTIATTLYLMLPMFNGADKVFRKILVPIARLQDLLLLRDAVQIKKRLLSELDPEQAKAVKRAIVDFYNDEDEDATVDTGSLRKDLLSSWQNVQVPGKKTLFSWFPSRTKPKKSGTADPTDNAIDEEVAGQSSPLTSTQEKEDAVDDVDADVKES